MAHHTDPWSHCGAPRPNIIIEGVLDEIGDRQRTCLLCAPQRLPETCSPTQGDRRIKYLRLTALLILSLAISLSLINCISSDRPAQTDIAELDRRHDVLTQRVNGQEEQQARLEAGQAELGNKSVGRPTPKLPR